MANVKDFKAELMEIEEKFSALNVRAERYEHELKQIKVELKDLDETQGLLELEEYNDELAEVDGRLRLVLVAQNLLIKEQDELIARQRELVAKKMLLMLEGA